MTKANMILNAFMIESSFSEQIAESKSKFPLRVPAYFKPQTIETEASEKPTTKNITNSS